MEVEEYPVVVADPDAVEFVAEHGGEVFVWADDAGLKHVRVERPDNDVSFRSVPASDLSLFVDREIDPPLEWKLVLRHFPHRHVDALYDGVSPGETPDLPAA
jgi:hypothetical protein